MTPWNLNPSIDMRWFIDDPSSVELECQQGTVHWFHGAKLTSPSIENSGDEMNLALRIICHLLVDHISDAGLPEVSQSLREFYEYYKPTECAQRILPEVRQVEAIMGSRVVRPAFTVEGE